MKRIITAAVVAGAVAGIFLASPVAQATSGQSNCLDPNQPGSYRATIKERGTGTITTASGRPLCSDGKLTFASYNVPETWDKKGWNKTAIPQTLFADTEFTFPAGKSDYTMTVNVGTPDKCSHTQLDFYTAPSYDRIDTLTGDDERNILGVLFAGKDKSECEEPAKTPGVGIAKLVNGKENTAVNVGEVFTYTIKVTNSGEVDLANTVMTDQAPAGVTLLSTDKGTISGSTLSYTIPSLKVGESITITVTAKVAEYKSGNLVNTACVNAAEVNPSKPDDKDACDDATVTVNKTTTPEPEPVTPTVPEQLPSTGVTDVLSATFGVGSLSGAGYYYLRSRRFM